MIFYNDFQKLTQKHNIILYNLTYWVNPTQSG